MKGKDSRWHDLKVTTLKERRLVLDACQNARDSSGLPTVDGTVIRPHALIRTDNHDRLSPAGQQAVRALGISLILDVRSAWEADKFRSPFFNEAFYRNVPLLDQADEETQALLSATTDLLSYYRIMIDRSASLLGRAISTMADAPPGGIVVHCHGGKDRTGIIIALALSLAGVPAQVIAQDYALTEECLQEHFANELAQLSDSVKREQLKAWQQSTPETMLAVLEHLDYQHAGVEQYLLEAGVTQDQLKKLRMRLRA